MPKHTPDRDTRRPVALVAHGNRMNALDRNRYTEAWSGFGASVLHPRAILVVSEHWYINATAATAMPRPRTIHDVYGFPPEHFSIEYPAPGDQPLADEVAEIAKPTWVGQDNDSGSGNVVRNLRAIDWSQPDAAYDWAESLDVAACELLHAAPAEPGRLGDRADYPLAVRTPDHFLALAYVAGLGAAAHEDAQLLVDGYAMGSRKEPHSL